MSLDPLQMLLDAARFIEHDKPNWAREAREAVARARRRQPQRAQEPVAWRWRHKGDDAWTYSAKHPNRGGHGWDAEIQPVYAAPQPPQGVSTIPLPLWAAEDLLKWMRKVRAKQETIYALGLENLLQALVAALSRPERCATPSVPAASTPAQRPRE